MIKLTTTSGTANYVTAENVARTTEAAVRPVAWEGGEGWESLAWQLCADENGEDACNELIWEGGPTPEPWGDRWLKYEDEAKRLIALVRKHTAQAAVEPRGLFIDLIAQHPGLADKLKVALPPVEGDKLPAVGTRVFIRLARPDTWVLHTVVGYYVWPSLSRGGNWRVFVRVKDDDGYLNARALDDIRLTQT